MGAARSGQKANGKRTSWWQTTAALLPCAMIAGAWGAAVALPKQPGPVDSAAYSAYAEGSPQVPVTGPDLQVTPLQDPVEQQSSSNAVTPAALVGAPSDIPGPALVAYQRAANVMAATKPECKLSWELLAAIGRVESNHGQFGGATVTSTGATSRAIIGIALDGSNNTARIPDTDKGAWDGDAKWDRAVGPMQFIPSTWSSVGVDADGDGKADPNNMNDAALGAAVYLCVGGHDLSSEAGARAALMSYNRSTAYADQVLALAARYGSSSPVSVLPSFPYPSSPAAPLGPVGPRPPSGGVPGGPGAGGSQPTPTIIALGIEKPPTPKPLDPGGITKAPKPAPGTPTKPPTKPTDPTDPTKPPTKPTDPTDPTKPPTKPTDPTDPTDPTKPPTKPTEPTTPPTTEPPPPTEPPTTEPDPEPTTAELAQAFCATLDVSAETLQKCIAAYVEAAPNGTAAAQDAARAAAA